MFTNLNKRIVLMLLMFAPLLGGAQTEPEQPMPHTLSVGQSDTLTAPLGAALLAQSDTASALPVVTPVVKADSTSDDTADDAIKEPVYSSGDDSTIYILTGEKRVLMYGNAKVTLEEMELTADFIDFNLETKTAYARGTYDSLGNVKGRPSFKQGNETFTMDSMYFNFNTKKAKIYTVVTQQQDGYLHGEAIKRMPDNTIYVSKGKYTSCDAEHPHFYFALTKAKVIPNDKVVAGPAYFVLEDVPTPLIIPFGLFPTISSRNSGVIIPSYGEEVNKGFFFRDGGYYFAINDYFDFTLTGSIYTLGSWDVSGRSSYVKRYAFNGNLFLFYGYNVIGERNMPDFVENKSFSITWNHNQDPKLSPNKTFSASVDYRTTSFSRFNERTLNDALTNTTNSSISYSQVFPGTPFSMSMALTHSQNTRDSIVNLGLPSLNINMVRITPFKRKVRVGQARWYEQIGIPLTVNVQNNISAKESEFRDLNHVINTKMKNGLKYNTSLSVPFTLAKYINLTPSISYNGRAYLSTIERSWVVDTSGKGFQQIDTIRGFAHNYDFSTGASATTRLYGMVQFGKDSKVQAIRHVVAPTVGMSWRPDFGDPRWGMYRTVQKDSLGNTQRYTPFEQGMFGYASQGKNASLNFALLNTLEMKIKSDADTVTGTRKLKLLEALGFNASYNLLADSMKLSDIQFNGRTTLFQGLSVTFNGRLSPYAMNNKGLVYDRWYVKDGKGLARLTYFNLTFGYSFNRTAKVQNTEQYHVLAALDPTGRYDGLQFAYTDFEMPWSFSFNYTFVYSKPQLVETVTQTLNFNGDFSLTKKWKMSFQSGYDLAKRSISATSVNLHRDLHCWEFRFSWIPFGTFQSWNFGINVKSSMLKDFKYDKRISRFDQIPEL